MPKKRPSVDLRTLHDAVDGVYGKLEEILVDLDGVDADADPETLREIQRKMFLLSMEASTLGCKLYTNIKIAVAEATLKKGTTG